MKRKFTPITVLGSVKSSAQEPTFKLMDNKIALISKRLVSLFSSEKPYLNVRYSIRQMADDIDIPSYLISAYLNQEVGLTFTDYINQYRVEHFKWLILSGEVGHFTLMGLAYKSGFGNRNTLTNAFKKLHGLTPSNFYRQAKRA